MGRWHSPGTPSLPPRHTFPGLRRWVRAGSYLHPPSHHPFHHHPHTSSRFRSHPLLPPLPLILAHGQRGRPCPGSLAWIPPLRALSSPLFLPTWVSLGGGGGEVCDWLVYFHLSHRIRSQQLWLGGIILYFPGSSTRENSQAQRIPEGGRVRKSNKEDALSKPPLPHHTQTHTLFFFFCTSNTTIGCGFRILFVSFVSTPGTHRGRQKFPQRVHITLKGTEGRDVVGSCLDLRERRSVWPERMVTAEMDMGPRGRENAKRSRIMGFHGSESPWAPPTPEPSSFHCPSLCPTHWAPRVRKPRLRDKK